MRKPTIVASFDLVQLHIFCLLLLCCCHVPRSRKHSWHHPHGLWKICSIATVVRLCKTHPHFRTLMQVYFCLSSFIAALRPFYGPGLSRGVHASTAVESCRCRVEVDSPSYPDCQVTRNHVSSYVGRGRLSSEYSNHVVTEYRNIHPFPSMPPSRSQVKEMKSLLNIGTVRWQSIRITRHDFWSSILAV